MSKKPRLTAHLRQQILAGIRSGGYPQIAAEAWGVSAALLQSWLDRGRGDKAREPYVSFAAAVAQAQAQARLRAEVALFDDDPRIWLQHGPGRETRDQPGWSAPVKPADTAAAATNPFLDPHFMALLNDMRSLLEPQPELHARFSDLIDGHRQAALKRR
ncbi:MAG: hypothetical protein U0793_14855 [Gemmataceae bacterium]